MIKYLFRHNKDYSRFNIIKEFTQKINIKKDVFILLPFSKNQFIKNFLKRERIINDFFISNYDTYVYDRKKIGKLNPRAWWKYFQDWINFKFSKYLLSDTKEHFLYWQELFGKFNGKHFILPVLADKSIYFPPHEAKNNDKIRILFYGSFIPLHGIDVILDAFKIMENQNIEYEANIIGNGQKYKEMKKKYDELKLKNVKMDGLFIPESDLSNEIRKSDIILGIFGESKKAQSVVPNKVYQSLASKKVTITMKSKAIEEFFDETQIVTCNPTSKELATQIIKFINDTTLSENIALNGYLKFCELYEDTQKNFEKFILEME
jgi:glycosyltransferase involved in cell wall biosynthesis